MVKHCTKCRRRWIVSVRDKRSQYICPECEGEHEIARLTGWLSRYWYEWRKL